MNEGAAAFHTELSFLTMSISQLQGDDMNKKMVPVLLLTLVNTLGFSLLIPVLPFMLRNWNMPDWSFGIMLSIYGLSQFWAAPLFGRLSDQYGRRVMLIWSHVGTLASWIVFGTLWFLDSWLQFPALVLLLLLVLSRLIDGITGGNNAVTQAYMADIVSGKDKVAHFGYLSAAMGIGMIIGPAIGAYTMATSITYLATASVGAAFSIVTLIALLLWLPESLTTFAAKTKIDWFAPFKFVKAIKTLHENPKVQDMFVAAFLLTASMGAYTSIMVFYLIDQFEFKETEIGNFLLAVGGFAIFNQLAMVKPIVKFFGEHKALLIGFSLLSVGLFSFPFITDIWVLVCSYYLVNLGFSVALPTIKGLLSNMTNSTMQGQTLGLMESVQALMFGVMPLFSTLLYGQMKVNSFFAWSGFAVVGTLFILVRTDKEY